MTRYLLWFAHELVDFRYPEILSITSMFNISIKFIEKPSSQKPYWIVELPDEESARKIASRSISLKSCIELWARAKTGLQLHENLKQSLKNFQGKWLVPVKWKELDISDSHICPFILLEGMEEKSFKIEVETFCKHFSMSEKIEKIEAFNYLPLQGPVKLKNPDVTLSYIEFYGTDPNNPPDLPYDLFFGRWVAEGQRDLIQQYSLKKRKFIGNTSMDAQLSFLMVNQAQVTPGHLVLDPFVGSGSVLVAAAHFGGHVWGSDIDYMMLHARTRPTRVGHKTRSKDESIRSNMTQYGVQSQYLDVVVSDFSLPLWRDHMQFDAIITDPPYGVREPTEKIGIDRENYTLSEEHLINHIPSKVDYGLPHMYGDLMTFAAKHLHKSHRFVCWYPVIRDEYDESMLPSHPCLKLVANSEQILTKLTARRLLTYEKISEGIPNVPVDLDNVISNFRNKYFAAGEMTRRQKKEKQSDEINSNTETNIKPQNVT
ncbi:tRNA (guanine(10)-N2)-methyltransferase homolog [Eumeta japonica]|uniref:tRNA (guanine(10)-N(2))-methyltransferase TRMT11 n=1 Tax=Eumeta variegata TaxID=151549 RepID=A0A4C1ZRU8_EUMVA|nr:tRNA (guanine(10)-N2)-methyltransferase homolog [Eumeta japonica]